MGKNLLNYRKDFVFQIRVIKKNVLFKNLSYLNFNFIGPFGFQDLFLSNKFFCSISGEKILLREQKLNSILNAFDLIICGICCGFFSRFNTIGYNYRIKSSFKFSYLYVFVGHFYSILLKFPRTVKIFRRKRFFTVFGTNFLDFKFIISYIRHLRDLYPYKTRGFVFRDESVSLKRGKKLKVK